MSRDRFLAAGIELFEDTGEFPSVKSVQRELEGWRDETNARREACRLPRSFGGLSGERVVLGVRAFERAEPGSPVLERFPAALRVGLMAYRKRDRQLPPTLSVADLAGAGMSEFRANQVLKLLDAESLVKKARGGTWEVMPSIRHYRSVRTVADYLRKKRRFERRRCRRSVFRKPLDTMRAALREEGPVRTMVIAAAGILLAAALLWAGRELVGRSSHSAPAPHPRAHFAPRQTP